jgi:hypothetical protein
MWAVACRKCMTASLRKYNFAYQADADTGQFRLSQVTMIGQEGTPERNVTLPVATYGYGRFTGADDGMIRYGLSQSIPLPSTFATAVGGIASTVTQPFDPNTALNFITRLTQKGLIDMNGDGRPDFASAVGVSPGFIRNRPGPAGKTLCTRPGERATVVKTF